MSIAVLLIRGHIAFNVESNVIYFEDRYNTSDYLYLYVNLNIAVFVALFVFVNLLGEWRFWRQSHKLKYLVVPIPFAHQRSRSGGGRRCEGLN